MKYVINSKIVVSVLFAVCVGAFTAQANVLVYEGFHASDYTLSTATMLRDANPTGHNNGFVADDVWAGGTAVPKTVAGSLTLGAAYDIAETNGTGKVVMSATGKEAKGRGTYRKFSASLPSSGTIYYRFLMKLNTDASEAAGTLQNGGYWAGGLVKNTFSGGSDGFQSLTTDGIWMGYKKVAVNNTAALSLFARIGSTDNVLPFNTVNSSPLLSTWSTYIFIAKIDIGAGSDGKDRVSVVAQPIATGAYSNKWDWAIKDVDANIVSGDTSVSYIALGGQYQTNGKEVAFDQFKIATTLEEVCNHVAAASPALGDVSLSRTGSATYSVSAEVLENPADTVSWIANDGTVVATNAFATSVETNTTASGTVSGLTADKTYQISVLAENASASASKPVGILYAGELALGSVTDAYEYNCVTGGVVVSRASADPFPLTVNYTISGSAGTEGTTWVAPVAVTIQAGAASAFLPVVPLMDGDVTEDITITVTLATGNYEIPSAASKTLTLYNLAAPAGKKTWVATANGNASDGANWLPAGPPTASDHILFDGAFSTRRCTWDAAATHEVASWEQTATYNASGTAGVIDFYTTYEDGDFPALAITGNCVVNGGKWTHKANSNAQVNRLSLTVGGDFTVGTGVEITASNKGYAQNCFPAGAAIGVHGGSVNNLSKVYGDFRHPIDIGAGGGSQNMTGGGAIHIVVAGTATVNGNINARANQGSGADTQIGAGGSIYIQAASVAGSGYISAAGYGDNDTRRLGAGGRIAVVCTTATTLDYDRSKFRCNGSIGGYGWSSGGGTIFVKTASQAHGTLIVANSVPKLSYARWWPTKRGVTPIPVGESWELDSIEFRGQGILCVPEGTSLKVPLSGVSSTNGDRIGGILYEGGTLDFGSAPYTLMGNWTFCADAPYTFDGDVTITNGANFGGFKLAGHYTNDFAKCDVTVNGDLTIASGGYASVELAGPSEANGNAECGGGLPMHGGQYAGQSGNKCYGSVFEPAYPGHFAQSGDHGSSSPGGGVLNLSVLGDMVVNGTVSANAVRSDSPSAAAGSINIVAKSLSGTGTITADGKPGGNVNSNQGYNGVGGRIAVRVTEQDVGETDIWTTFSARGIATNQVSSTSANNRNASAGTIYLQGKSDGEKGGTIYVKNQASYDTSNVATWLPAGTLGDDAKDFAKSKLVIADRGVVAIGADVKFASVSIAANSKLDLHGQKVRVASATLGGTKLAAGTYTASDDEVSDFVVDSAGGGTLTVGGGFYLIVR